MALDVLCPVVFSREASILPVSGSKTALVP